MALAAAGVLTIPVALVRAGTLSGIVAGFLHAAWFAWEGGAAVVLAFIALVVIGTSASRVGWASKERLGVAQTGGGRRSARHVLANAGAAAFVLLLGAVHPAWSGWSLIGACSALAGSLADTVAGEWGMLVREEPRLLLFGPVVPRGTDGGMTWAGVVFSFLAGVGTAGLVACTGGGFHWAIVAGGISGSVIDSILGATLERRGILDNEMVNFGASSGAALVGCLCAVGGAA